MSALPPIAELHGGDGLHALCGIPSFASAAANARLYWSAGKGFKNPNKNLGRCSAVAFAMPDRS